MSTSSANIDFKKLFEALPDKYMILLPDFTIADVSDAYAAATKIVRETVIGKGVFEVFPDDPNDPGAHGVENLSASLKRALELKKTDKMPIQKYNIPKPDGSGFEERYWDPQNTPMLVNNEVVCIIHHAEDVTHKMETDKTLEEKVKELQMMNEAMVDREVKMIELKKEIEVLQKIIAENKLSAPSA